MRYYYMFGGNVMSFVNYIRWAIEVCLIWKKDQKFLVILLRIEDIIFLLIKFLMEVIINFCPIDILFIFNK